MHTHTQIYTHTHTHSASSSGRVVTEALAPQAATRATSIASNVIGDAFSTNYNDRIGRETRTDFYSECAQW